jgi:hypothetical protein
MCPPYNFRTNASAPLENFDRSKKSTFSTASVINCRRDYRLYAAERPPNAATPLITSSGS